MHSDCDWPGQVWEAHKHLNEGIASGEVQPLPWTVFSRDKAQDAFRFLAGGVSCNSLSFCSPLANSDELSRDRCCN